MGARNESDREEKRAKLQSMHASMQTWMNEFGGVKTARKKHVYDSRTLLQAIKSASLLKGGADRLCEAIARALAMALPKCFQEEFLSVVSEEGDEFGETSLHERLERDMPSESLVRRYERLYFAAAPTQLRSMFYKCFGIPEPGHLTPAPTPHPHPLAPHPKWVHGDPLGTLFDQK
jgi:hypothetical protein